MSSFSIERGDQIIHNVFFADKDYKLPPISDMNFEELVNYEGLSDIVDALLDATDGVFGPGSEDVFITLVDDEGYFVWSISIQQYDSDFEYRLIDWRRDDEYYCYEAE